jgi:hypothetical protein
MASESECVGCSTTYPWLAQILPVFGKIADEPPNPWLKIITG